MVTVIEKKIENYLTSISELESEYQTIKSSTTVGDLSQDLNDLYDFDQLLYTFQAIRSYYEHSKSRWNSDYRNLLDDFASLNDRTKSKLPIAELTQRIPELAVLRRNLQENAKEGGRLAAKLVLSEFNLSKLNINWQIISKPHPREHAPSPTPSESQHLSSGNASSNSPQNIPQDAPREVSPNAHSSLTKETAQTDSSTKDSPQQEILVIEDSPIPDSEDIQAKDNTADATQTAPSKPQSSELTPNVPHKTLVSPVVTNEQSHSPNPQGNVSEKTIPRIHSLATPQENPLAIPQKDPMAIPQKDPMTIPQVSIPEKASLSPGNINDHTNHPSKYTQLSLNETKENHNICSISKRTRESDESQFLFPEVKRTTDANVFKNFTSWTREHCSCVIDAASSNRNNPVAAVQQAIATKFAINITPPAAETLLRHYGLRETYKDHYKAYNSMFRSTAAMHSQNKLYVLIPWTNIRLSYKRSSGRNMPDWEVKERYYLYLLHRKVYGEQGEPFSNYTDLVEAYHREENNKTTTRDENSSGNESTAFSQAHISYDNKNGNQVNAPSSDIISAPSVSTSVSDAILRFPAGTEERLHIIQEYVHNQTGHLISLELIEKAVTSLEAKRNPSRVGSPGATGLEYRATTNIQTSPNNQRSPNTRTHQNKQNSPNKQIASKSQTYSPTKVPSEIHSPDKQRVVGVSLNTEIYHALKPLMLAHERPISFYHNLLSEGLLTDPWTFERSKCIISTISFVSGIGTASSLYFARLVVLKLIITQLSWEHHLIVSEEQLRDRIKTMIQYQVFDVQSMLLLKDLKI